LALGAAAGAGVAFGVASGSPAAAHSVVQYSTIWNQPTYYVDTGARTSFYYNTTFHSQLDSWMMDWYGYTPTNWITPIQLYSNGVHVDKPGMHMYGRAMDFSRIMARIYGVGTNLNVCNARYDIWRSWTGDSLYTVRRWYWGSVASFNKYFGVVLHYEYNSEHFNHIHVDNSEPNSFNVSYSQVKMVQAVCRYVWNYPNTPLTGSWDGTTDANSRAVLSRMGRSGGLTTSTANWHAFCMVSLGQATGRFLY
jgi:hypothetical protein